VMLADERFLNPVDRFHEGLVAQLKRLMVDGHYRTGARGVRHGDGLFGRAVVVDVGVVGANRHHGGVERTKAAMTVEHRRDRSVSTDQETSAFAFDDPSGVPTPRVAPNTRT